MLATSGNLGDNWSRVFRNYPKIMLDGLPQKTPRLQRSLINAEIIPVTSVALVRRPTSAEYAAGSSAYSIEVPRVLDPFRFVLIAMAGWMNQRQLQIID